MTLRERVDSLGNRVPVLYLAGQRFIAAECMTRASALSFSTITSFVPILALALAVTRAVGLLDPLLRGVVAKGLDRVLGAMPVGRWETLAGNQQIRVAANQLVDYLSRVDVWALGVFGILSLLYTMTSVFGEIETTLDKIWGHEKGRGFLKRTGRHLLLFFLTPLALGGGAAVVTATESNAVVKFLSTRIGSDWLVNVMVDVIPFLLVGITLAGVYRVLPREKTRMRSVLVGATVGAVLWQIALMVHLFLQATVARTSPLYAGFAAIPVFMVWLYLSWVAVLVGAAVASAHQTVRAKAKPETAEPETAEPETVAPVTVASETAEPASDGHPSCSILKVEAPMTNPSSQSIWAAINPAPIYPVLEGNLIADVIVVGAGITGLSTALRLAELGKGVVVLEARTVGSGTTGSTTGHVTEALDTRYTQIESAFGLDNARLVADASRAAIEQVAVWCEKLAIAGFQRLPGFLYSESATDREALEAEQMAASRAGAQAHWTTEAPLAFAAPGAVRFDDQAQIDMGTYLAGLARGAMALGVRIYENSRVLAVDDAEPCMVHLENGATVRARSVVFATHTPLNRLLLQTKLAHYQSYVMAFSGVSIPSALHWDSASPYHYLRMVQQGGQSFLVVGGEDHKTGAEERTQNRFDRLMEYTRQRFGDAAQLELQWSGQVLEPNDGLPMIGRNSASQNVYVATGFSGNGLTMGTVAALLISDLVTRRSNAWESVFDATRITPSASVASFVRENIDFPVHLIGDWLAPTALSSVALVAPDEGRIVSVHGERLAVYRDVDGGLHAASAVCTHLGCLVKFNDAERTWDCPCHGSRFDVDGTVLEGPATHNLAKRHVVDTRQGRQVVGGGMLVPLRRAR